jgi:signal transduction histidine kinase
VVVRIDGSAADTVRFEVRNRGAIPPHLLPVVFEPLRLSRPEGRQERREGSSGLGLGLYITRQIAIAHGGTIRVESNDADGTSFVVELPRRPRPE